MRGLHSVAVSVIPLLRVRTETPSLAELLQIQECDIFAIKANVSLKGERNHGYLIKKLFGIHFYNLHSPRWYQSVFIDKSFCSCFICNTFHINDCRKLISCGLIKVISYLIICVDDLTFISGTEVMAQRLSRHWLQRPTVFQHLSVGNLCICVYF